MNDLDEKIAAALDEEDRVMFDQLGEQGVITQWFSAYRGKQAWVAIIVSIVIFVIASFSIYSIYRAFLAGDSLEAMQWGASAAFLSFMVAFLKMWFWMRLEANRIIREIKRVELQIVRMQSRQSV